MKPKVMYFLMEKVDITKNSNFKVSKKKNEYFKLKTKEKQRMNRKKCMIYGHNNHPEW